MPKVVERRRSRDIPAAETDPTPAERQQFLDAVRSGLDPSKAAAAIPCSFHATGHRTASMFGRLARRDADFAELYAAALEERQSVMEDRVDDLVARRAEEPDAPPALVLGFAARWNRGFRWRERTAAVEGEAQSFELTRPLIDVSLLSDAQLEELDEKLRRCSDLIAIGQGHAPNLEREALSA